MRASRFTPTGLVIRERAQVHADAIGHQGLTDDILGLETPILARADARTGGAFDLTDMFEQHAGRLGGERAWLVFAVFDQRHGMAVGRVRRQRTPPYAQPFGSCQEANGVWCADFKGWFRTADRMICHPLTITDAFSRYLLRCQGMERAWTIPAKTIFESAFREYGLPQAIRTDNGAPFASKAVGGLSRLAIWWLKLEIVPERIEPGQPQQNGRHERMHLTLKQETANPPRGTMRSQQRRFDEFRLEYNEQRPHEALEQRTPAELYRMSPRAYPARMPEPEYGDGMEVRFVRHSGEIKWEGRRMYLGEVLAGENVALEPLSDEHWLVYFCKMPLGVLDDRRRKVWSVEAAMRKGWLSADALPSPFRCAPGTGQSMEV